MQVEPSDPYGIPQLRRRTRTGRPFFGPEASHSPRPELSRKERRSTRPPEAWCAYADIAKGGPPPPVWNENGFSWLLSENCNPLRDHFDRFQ